MRSLTNCFQNTDPTLVFKQKFLACKQKMDKAGIGFKFGKKFLNSEKKKNPQLDDTAVTEAATNHLFRTM